MKEAMDLLTHVRRKKLIGLTAALGLLLLAAAYHVPPVAGSDLAQENPVYIVQQGDTLNSIALRFGITSEEIQSANGIADPNALAIGQRLIIPGLEGISGVLTSERIPFGTTLQSLTRQYQLDQADLAFLNRITSPSETIAGVKFIIPVNEGRNPLSPIASVGTDETLLEAAIKTGTSPWNLLNENQLAGTWDIIPGEILFASLDEEVAQTPLPGMNGIWFNNLPVVQGETLQIGLSSGTQAAYSGNFRGSSFEFFTQNDQDYYSFIGIHALAEPGIFPLRITTTFPDGRQQSFDQPVLLVEGGYGSEWVSVSEDYLDQEAIEEEDAYLASIFQQSTPEKYWDGQFKYPVDEPCINSSFGQRRDYNNGSLFFYHTGIDFAVCAQNLNVYAPAAGRIVVAEELFVKGKAIIIDHGWGVYSGYWHLSEFNASVGDFVEPGDLIGYIGNTGRSAGPHLHFEIDIAGVPVNPKPWLDQTFPQSEP